MNPTADANAIYNPAVQQAQAQMPAIQQLYQSLNQGLIAQAAQAQNNIGIWAQRAGVATPMLNQQIGLALQQEAGLQGQQVAAEAARGQAGLGQQIGQMNVGRAQAIQSLNESLQKQNLENQQNAYEMSNIERKAQLEQQKNQWNYEETDASKRAQARANRSSGSGVKGLSDLSKTDIERALRIRLNAVRGSDGHVSPENLANAYKIWESAGLAEKDFWGNFQGLWNPNQGTYDQEFQYFRGR